MSWLRLLRVASYVLLTVLLPAGAVAAHAGRVGVGLSRLVYASDWSGAFQLYAVDPSSAAPGGQVTFAPRGVKTGLGFSLADHHGWSFSPNGRRVLYSSSGGKNSTGVYVADADGSHTQLLAEEPSGAFGWSPDSRRIAWMDTRGLHVAYPDGSRARLVGTNPTAAFAWSPDSLRIAWPDARGLHFANADGSHARLIAKPPIGPIESFSWSPDGRSYCYVWSGLLEVRSEGRTRQVASGVSDYAWSPTGSWIAVRRQGGWYVVHPDGTGMRLVRAGTFGYQPPQWSADGRWLALVADDDGLRAVEVYDARSERVDKIANQADQRLAWSPVRDQLAFSDWGGLKLADLDRGVVTTLAAGSHPDALSWSPDGDRLAYVEDSTSGEAILGPGRDLKTVDLSGSIRTVMTASRPLGGVLTGFAWVDFPRSVRLKAPAPRSLGTLGHGLLQALWPIDQLAVNGDTVAYSACGHVFVWTPVAQTIEQADPLASLSPWCWPATTDYLYELAVANGRVADATAHVGITAYWYLTQTTLGPNGSAHEDDAGQGQSGSPYNPALGQLAGAGSLLVYSSWHEGGNPPSSPYPVTAQTLKRLEPDGTTTPLHVEPGPFVTGNVNADRIALYTPQHVLILDRNGQQLLSLPIQALGVRLNGHDLVVLTQARLHDYDATTGQELASWPLPDVPTGQRPGSANDFTAPAKNASRLQLDDLAHGLALYHLNGQIHLLRLADGTDTTIAASTLARFTNTGLIYATGSTLHLVLYADLPGHSSGAQSRP